MSDNITVGYSPNNFFYTAAIAEKQMPQESDCKNLKPNDQSWEMKCNQQNFSTNSTDCIRKELCKNKDLATSLTNMENSNSGVVEKYMNEKMNYDNMLMNAINLGIGIVFLIVIIYKNQK